MDKVDYETYDSIGSNDVYDSMELSSTEKVIVFGLLFEKKRCNKINIKLSQHQKRFNVSFKAPKVIRPQKTERDGIKRKVGKTFNLE